MPRGDGYGGRRAQRWVAAVLNQHGTTCHLCRHGGAESADHIKPRATHPWLMYDVTNGRPVHHRACPVCGRTCNTSRGTDPIRTAEPLDRLAEWGGQ